VAISEVAISEVAISEVAISEVAIAIRVNAIISVLLGSQLGYWLNW